MPDLIPHERPWSTDDEIRDLRLQVEGLQKKLKSARLENRGLREGLRSQSPPPPSYHESGSTFLSTLHTLGFIEPTTCYVCGLLGYWIRRVADGKFRFLLRSGERHTHTVLEFAAADKRGNPDNTYRKQALMRLDRTKKWRA